MRKEPKGHPSITTFCKPLQECPPVEHHASDVHPPAASEADEHTQGKPEQEENNTEMPLGSPLLAGEDVNECTLCG